MSLFRDLFAAPRILDLKYRLHSHGHNSFCSEKKLHMLLINTYLIHNPNQCITIGYEQAGAEAIFDVHSLIQEPCIEQLLEWVQVGGHCSNEGALLNNGHEGLHISSVDRKSLMDWLMRTRT